MIAEQILFEISKCPKGAKMDFRIAWSDIDKEHLWFEEVRTNNLESLVFELSGHKPLTDVFFLNQN